jgi:hypothetical protein
MVYLLDLFKQFYLMGCCFLFFLVNVILVKYYNFTENLLFFPFILVSIMFWLDMTLLNLTKKKNVG